MVSTLIFYNTILPTIYLLMYVYAKAWSQHITDVILFNLTFVVVP
jgi:hypothetical protein